MSNTDRQDCLTLCALRARGLCTQTHWLQVALTVSLAVLLMGASPASAAGEQDVKVGRTPPRLSFVDGQVWFWRVGQQDWQNARLNIALAPGDLLYTGDDSNFELQVGGRAFVRAGADTQLGLVGQEPDYLRLKLTQGTAAIDVRGIAPGHTIEVETPNSAVTIDHPGYYRVDVHEDTTAFTARRGGRAVLTPGNGRSSGIASGEQAVVEGAATPQLATYQAPALDGWDHWNYDRTDELLQARSDRYLSPDMYGAEDLDRYGNWRIEPSYGRVWVPPVTPGWTPYSTGRWMWDPYYGWTWVDDAPWGWAPFHYGRWVYFDNYWAWAPGPIPVAVRPVYAPALVAFFGGSGVHVGVGIGVPFVSWVALGWGEPLVPWWGPVGFVGRPWWAGWCGPRLYNNVVVDRHTVIHVNKIVYRNVHVRHGVVGVPRDEFGRGAPKLTRFERIEQRHLRPLDVPKFKPVMARSAPPAERPRRGFGVPEYTNESLRRRAERGNRPGLTSQPSQAPPAGAMPRQPRSERLQTREQQRAAPPPPQPGARAAEGVAPGNVPRQSRSERLQERSRPPAPPRSEPAPAARLSEPPAARPQRDSGVGQPRRDRLEQHREAAPPPNRGAAPPVKLDSPVSPPREPRSYQPRSQRLRQMQRPQSPRVEKAPPPAPRVEAPQPAPAPQDQPRSSRSDRLQERR